MTRMFARLPTSCYSGGMKPIYMVYTILLLLLPILFGYIVGEVVTDNSNQATITEMRAQRDKAVAAVGADADLMDKAHAALSDGTASLKECHKELSATYVKLEQSAGRIKSLSSALNSSRAPSSRPADSAPNLLQNKPIDILPNLQ